jgi:xanthine/CO dehydrogenase XdhC/CoxF family maturation factor
MTEIAEILKLLDAHPGSPAVLATLVRVDGSSYRRPGARLLWLADGAHAGSISGGCLEEDLIERARRALATGRAEVATYDTAAENDIVWGTGTGCDGRVTVLLEPLPPDRPRWVQTLRANLAAQRSTALAVAYGGLPEIRLGTRLADDPPAGAEGGEIFAETVQPPYPLVVFGAGDDAQPLVRMALELGWQVTVVDSRPAYATATRFPGAAVVIVWPAEFAAESVPLGPRTLAVVMTHRYRDDLALLPRLLTAPLAYLGLLGPRHRMQRLLSGIEGSGLAITPEMRARLHAPVGLDIGGRTPETVALSILAEIQARLAGRSAGFLRDGPPGPIHD